MREHAPSMLSSRHGCGMGSNRGGGQSMCGDSPRKGQGGRIAERSLAACPIPSDQTIRNVLGETLPTWSRREPVLYTPVSPPLGDAPPGKHISSNFPVSVIDRSQPKRHPGACCQHSMHTFALHEKIRYTVSSISLCLRGPTAPLAQVVRVCKGYFTADIASRGRRTLLDAWRSAAYAESWLLRPVSGGYRFC